MSKDVLIVGGGGHGKVVAYTVLAVGRKVLGFLDDNHPVGSELIKGVPCLGKASMKYTSHPEAEFIVALGNNDRRRELFLLHSDGRIPALIIHPSAVVFPDAEIGKGTIILAGTVIMNGTSIGKNCIINARAVIDHDCRVEDHVHVGLAAVLKSHSVIPSGETRN